MLKVCAPSPPVPHDVEQVAGVGHRHLGGEFAHDLRGGGDFADGFLLHPQAHVISAAIISGDISPAHDLAHQRQHLVVENLAVLDAAQQRFLWRDRHDVVPVLRLRKLRSSCVAVLGQDRSGMKLHALDCRMSCGARP